MNQRLGKVLLLGIAAVLVGLVAAQVGYGFINTPGADSPEEVAIQELANDSEEYLDQRVVVEGWYQGGLLRDANPLCANTREGVQEDPYAYVFTDIRANVTLITGVEYRFVGTLRPSSEVDMPTVQSKPVFVVHEVERLGRNPEECSFVPETEQN